MASGIFQLFMFLYVYKEPIDQEFSMTESSIWPTDQFDQVTIMTRRPIFLLNVGLRFQSTHIYYTLLFLIQHTRALNKIIRNYQFLPIYCKWYKCKKQLVKKCMMNTRLWSHMIRQIHSICRRLIHVHIYKQNLTKFERKKKAINHMS